jgi:hypothetical protein
MPISTRKTKRNHFKNNHAKNRENNGLGQFVNSGPRVIVPHIIENLLPNNVEESNSNNSNRSNNSYNSIFRPHGKTTRKSNYERVRNRILNNNNSNNSSNSNNSNNGNNYKRVRNRILKKNKTNKVSRTANY